jgi:uncharacterized protein YbaR (Trm112 family)/SAM-dependent methyltransferase
MPFDLDMPKLIAGKEIFICPQTKIPLRAMSLEDAKQALGSNDLVPRANVDPEPFGVTETLMVRSDSQCAYPVVDGIPILLAPEQITSPDRQESFDLEDIKYAEAYQEMTHYNQVGMAEAAKIREAQSFQLTQPVLRLTDAERESFPEPKEAWLDCVPDCKAQYESYRYLLPVKGKRVLQLGGKGIHAVKFLLAGAAEAWVITPMLGEVCCAIALAKETGVVDRLRCAVGIAEETPIAENTFDGIYSAGSVHHMTTEMALPEIARVLKPGGRFSSFDPWRAPFYKIGSKILGKREVNVYCRPLTRQRVSPLYTSFDVAKKAQYGTLTRYAGLALNKFGVSIRFRVWWQLYRFDDGFCSFIPGLRNLGSSVALFGTKEHA